MVIWALFDSEHDTVKKSFPQLEVYSFGLGSGTTHIPLDLSNFAQAKKELDKYPKPDIVFASPPCETWSYVSVGTKRFFTAEPGINLYWRKKWVPFDFTQKYIDRRKNGIATLETLAQVIRHYEPGYWFIENGVRSLAFAYLKENLNLAGYKNLTNYYSYGFEFLKPTIIYSNIFLQLKNNSPTTKLRKIVTYIPNFTKTQMASYRSRVPVGLYIDIFNQAKSGGVPLLNFQY